MAADVQTEKGYTEIADELLEALARTAGPDYEKRVIIFIIRKTYGWKKTWDRISLSQIMEGTGIKAKSNASNTMKSLVDKNIVERRTLGDGKGYEVRLQKDYEQWVGYRHNRYADSEPLADDITVSNLDNKGLFEQPTKPLVNGITTIESNKEDTIESSDSTKKPLDTAGKIKIVLVDWNAMCISCKCRSVTRLDPPATSTRGKLLRKRIKDDFFRKNYRAALKKVEASAFCNGDNDRDWTADIDFFCRDDRVEQLLEGKFDGKVVEYNFR